MNYTFYCDRSDAGTNLTRGPAAKFDGRRGAWLLIARGVCTYETPRTYTAKVIAERGNTRGEARTTIVVTSGGDETLGASLTASPSGGSAPLRGVDLTARAFGSAAGTINYTFYCDRPDVGTAITRGWDAKFDGVRENPKTVQDACSYSRPGTYVAKVVVERGSAPPAEARATITVREPATSNEPPVARFEMCSSSLCARENETLNLTVSAGAAARVSFSAARSSDPEGSIVSYRWQINGSEVSTRSDFSFDLGRGRHDVLLTVTDNRGVSRSVGGTVFVEERVAPNEQPVARFTICSVAGCVNENETLELTVQPGGSRSLRFSAERSSDPDGSIVSYRWQINGSEVSTSRDFSFDLGRGRHDIFLTITDNRGAARSVGGTVVIAEVSPPPTALASPTDLTFGLRVGSGYFLSWNPSPDSRVTAYEVLQGGSVLTRTAATAYTLGSLSCNTIYTFSVRAVDASGNSSQSLTGTFMTNPC